ncbi:unnamed protein product [Vicia faba]|uniref:Uncharacterized protein n=1 Tax=Vicia faba TaxID=3906 RepID=A0AAV1AZ38_VICFA|nr:unnamed protein product [Vicia faba]
MNMEKQCRFRKDRVKEVLVVQLFREDDSPLFFLNHAVVSTSNSPFPIHHITMHNRIISLHLNSLRSLSCFRRNLISDFASLSPHDHALLQSFGSSQQQNGIYAKEVSKARLTYQNTSSMLLQIRCGRRRNL